MIDLIAVGTRAATCANKLSAILQRQGIRLVAETRQLPEALQLISDFRHDILLLDFTAEAGDQVALIRLLRASNPAIKILLVTEQTPDELILDGLAAGAKGYLEHEACGVFLAKAVEAIAMGEVWMSRRLVASLLERLTQMAEQSLSDAKPGRPAVSKLLH